MICLKCKQEINDNTKFCTICGSQVPRCPVCGMVLTRKMRFCTHDGTPIPDSVLALFDDISPDQPQQPQRILTPQEVREFNARINEREMLPQKKSAHRIRLILLLLLLIIVLAVSGVASYKIISFETSSEIEETVSEQVFGYEGKDAI